MTTALFTSYSLELHVDEIAGGLPRDPEMVRRWQEATLARRVAVEGTPTVDEAVEATIESLGDQVADRDAGGWIGFASPTGSLCIEQRQIKAMLKEAANVVRPMMPIGGKVIPLRARLAERVFVLPKWIEVLPLRSQPDETRERPIHVMTAMGPRDSLKRVDVCTNVDLRCTLKVLNDGIFTEERLNTLLEYAGLNGVGADRSQGMGTFTHSLIPL